MSLEGLAVVHGVDKAIEYNGQQILFDNFIVQAMRRKKPILKYNKKTCYNPEVNKLEFDPNNKNIMKNAYLWLYEYLVKTNFIRAERNMSMIWTWSYSYKVNIEGKTVTDLKNALSLAPEKLKCFNINANELYSFLKSYRYDPQDEVRLLSGGRRSRRRRTRRKLKI